MTQKIKIILIALFLTSSLNAWLTPSAVRADSSDQVPAACQGKTGADLSNCKICHPTNGAQLTADQLKSCEACNSTNPALNDCLQNNDIVKVLQTIVNFLSGAVVVIVIATIIWGGIQYTIAGDSAEKVTAARKRITNGVIAFAAFMFIWAFLQWLIPGGIFGTGP
ncbi:MAG TPA: pilin [Candidatus Saccharimonadales bacterium]|nr:pilin [Candidatus Saccharimonadales bacterium]